MSWKLILPLTIIYLNEIIVRVWIIVERYGSILCRTMELSPLHCCTATIRFGCDVSKWRQMVRTVETYDMGVYFLIKERDFRAEKLIISEMEIVMFGVQELSTVTLSMCHWNWDQKKCLEEEQA
ncbi:hypothetical protein T08_1803 [Trichinella sp. T8]|nr:hypothetical protein T08_1803 [Trichinella sp. T8]